MPMTFTPRRLLPRVATRPRRDAAASLHEPLLISYLTLRKLVGGLGMLLPVMLALGGWWVERPLHVEPSLSAYYHTPLRDVFVGTMFAIGVFLSAYRGHDQRDSRAGTSACVGAVGLALFPTAPLVPESRTAVVVGHVHLGFASVFFLSLAYFSLCLFTESARTQAPTLEKQRRNRVYRGCGLVMLAALGLIIGYQALPDTAKLAMESHSPVFWLESTAIMAFGVSWFTKGEGLALLKDKRPGQAAN
ncbi:hypothetical protein [Caldimonas brevitalea]|uniref:DUF998 domain-containing protein n=1 Tax=Caldimonas brevitalea TaxID=413882 RepID=A0A0G3BFF5_9BURK|nr:hypothetical protein [Caldimonas brevitalea]AKJ26703.1 hypothetical protein AAW51_0012 [Caldimonas brevitalea]